MGERSPGSRQEHRPCPDGSWEPRTQAAITREEERKLR